MTNERDGSGNDGATATESKASRLARARAVLAEALAHPARALREALTEGVARAAALAAESERAVAEARAKQAQEAALRAAAEQSEKLRFAVEEAVEDGAEVTEYQGGAVEVSGCTYERAQALIALGFQPMRPHQKRDRPWTVVYEAQPVTAKQIEAVFRGEQVPGLRRGE